MRAATEITLSGGSAWRVDRPPAKLPTRGLLSWQTIVSVSGVILSVEATLRGRRDAKRAQLDSERAQRDSERAQRESERAQRESDRAQRESDEGRIQAAVDRMMQPFPPQKDENEVIKRGVIKAIQQRILRWDQHATIIAGRFGSGKSVAVEEAIRGRQGVFVHRVEDADWKEQLFKRLGLDGPDMFEEVLRRVGGKLQRPPILVLDIPLSAKRGGGVVEAFVSLCYLLFCIPRHGYGFQLRQDSVVGRIAGARRDPKTQSCFCRAAVGSCKLSEFCRGDRLRLLGRHGPRLRCRWTAASGQLLGG